jgi:hypothetical protein
MYRFVVNIDTPAEPAQVKALIDWVDSHQSHGAVPTIGVSKAYNRLLAWQEQKVLINRQGLDFKFWFNSAALACEFAALHGTEARLS